MKRITITGSEGLIGKELCKYFEKKFKVLRLDLKLGHDLTDEQFVNKFRKKNTLYNFPLESFSKYMDVNLTSLFSVCREFARNNKDGSIVNFSSYLGLVSARPDLYDGSHKDIAYCVSKSGVINLTKYLAIHLAPNFRVNCVIPGGIELNQNKKFIQKYSQNTPLKRMMKKTELNGLIDYLCSGNSGYVTGSAIVADGGYTSW
jgi:NAD(P)-dependent dehydrogenase (short-subunit alcohol dehydrogenase family)